MQHNYAHGCYDHPRVSNNPNYSVKEQQLNI